MGVEVGNNVMPSGMVLSCVDEGNTKVFAFIITYLDMRHFIVIEFHIRSCRKFVVYIPSSAAEIFHCQ